jgi:hypothetical protein
MALAKEVMCLASDQNLLVGVGMGKWSGVNVLYGFGPHQPFNSSIRRLLKLFVTSRLTVCVFP